ncbi:MAG: 50S ribosomal protein L1 [Dehalococcoidia bacterium]|nr:50S ribosomal protein L1 [Dehalococcoidia bacterium]
MTTVQKPSIVKRSRRFKTAAALVQRGAALSPEEAMELVKKTATAKHDETIEVHIRTTVDPQRQAQGLRGVVVLPHGVGKTVRVMAFVQGEAATAARQAGADYIGDDETIQRIEKDGWSDFEVSVATPDMMGRIGRLGRVLGRKGLMPNPRTGTVVPAQDIAKAVSEAKRGRLEFRADKTAIIHSVIGKKSFAAQQLVDNFTALLDAINKARPEGIKGPLIRSLYVTSTMGPSIKLDVAKATVLKVE